MWQSDTSANTYFRNYLALGNNPTGLASEVEFLTLRMNYSPAFFASPLPPFAFRSLP